MKKIFVAVIAMYLSQFSFSQPPQGPPKPPSAEDRWQHDSKKINEALGLSQVQLDKLKVVFIDFYNMDALREKMEPPKPPKEEMEKIMNKRNDQLKKVLSEGQLQKFSEVDKTLGPRERHGEHKQPQAKLTPTK
jgi:hypothetical protein